MGLGASCQQHSLLWSEGPSSPRLTSLPVCLWDRCLLPGDFMSGDPSLLHLPGAPRSPRDGPRGERVCLCGWPVRGCQVASLSRNISRVDGEISLAESETGPRLLASRGSLLI